MGIIPEICRLAGYAKGMYLITIQTEKERLTKKMMVE
jgi:hypothetical protein